VCQNLLILVTAFKRYEPKTTLASLILAHPVYSNQTSTSRMNRRLETYNTVINHNPKRLKFPVSLL